MTTFLNWYVLNVRAASEERAAGALEEKGYRVFCPMYKKLKAPSRYARGKAAKKLVELHPLMRGYLFAFMDPLQLAQVTGVREVFSVLKVDDRPARVASSVIEAIQHHCEMGTYDDVQEIKLFAGDQVIVSTGPYEGYTGIVIQRPKSDNRVDVEINGFKVVSSLDNLRKLKDQGGMGDGGTVCIPPRDERRTDPADPNRGFSPLTKSASKSSKKFMSG